MRKKIIKKLALNNKGVSTVLVLILIIILGIAATFILFWWVFGFINSSIKKPRLSVVQAWLWADDTGTWHLTINIQNSGGGAYTTTLTTGNIHLTIFNKGIVTITDVDPTNITIPANGGTATIELTLGGGYDPGNANVVKGQITLPGHEAISFSATVERG
ncbi:MAG: hypothetical protein DRN04_07420 [Thermoprotei archaeon]|nr:MAG: hypothetical protein DRN04_07420 [Thermoprotei archaeon]